MGFSRTWLRALYKAAGTAVVVPVGLVLSIVLAATVGGSGIGGLRQLIAGPSLPSADPVARALDHPGSERQGTVPVVPHASGTRLPTTRLLVKGLRSPSPRDRERARRPVVRKPSRRPQRPGRLPVIPISGAPQRQADPVGEAVRGVGKMIEDTVRPVPIAGPPAADAVGTLVDLVAPEPPPAPAPVVPVLPILGS